MTQTQIPLIEVRAEPLLEQEPLPETRYLVVAYKRLPDGRGYWRCFHTKAEQFHRTRDLAETAAKKLAPTWTHRRIVEVKL